MLSGVPTRRLVAYGAVLVLLVAGGVAAFFLTRPSAKPVWAGPPLDTNRTTRDGHLVMTLTPEDLPGPAGRALGATRLTERGELARGAKVYDGAGGVEVRVRPERPTVIFAQRPAATGPAPSPEKALTATARVMQAYGMSADQWEPTVSARGGLTVVRYTMISEYPVFQTAGVPSHLASFAVDAKGVQTMTLTLVAFLVQRGEVMSQREAFDRLTRPGRYVGVRMVLVDDGKGTILPYWEFKTVDGKLRPVRAVLTP